MMSYKGHSGSRRRATAAAAVVVPGETTASSSWASSSSSSSSSSSTWWWFVKKGFQGFLLWYIFVIISKNISMFLILLNTSTNSPHYQNDYLHPSQADDKAEDVEDFSWLPMTMMNTTKTKSHGGGVSVGRVVTTNIKNINITTNNIKNMQKQTQQIMNMVMNYNNMDNNATSSFLLNMSPEWTSPACQPYFIRKNQTTSSTNTTKQQQQQQHHHRHGRNKITRIYFAHMRKAGGMTLRKYLKKVAMTYNLEFHAEEAGFIERPLPLSSSSLVEDGNDDDTSNSNTTFYITHMRDPVERSISHFKYEGRWNCQNLLLQNQKQQQSQTQHFIPTTNNSNSLHDWIYTEFQNNSQWTSSGHGSTGKYCERKLWLCSTNCYIKWIHWKPGQRRKNNRNRNRRRRLQYHQCIYETQYPYYYVSHALELFGNYNLIINMDQLRESAVGSSSSSSSSSSSYATQLEAFFGVKGLIDYKNIPTICEKPSKQANKKYPLHVSDNEYKELYHKNTLDYQVYNSIMDCHHPTSKSKQQQQQKDFDTNNKWVVNFPKDQTLADFV